MRSRRIVPILAVLSLAVFPVRAEAQIGPIIDWISKLSGPGVVRFGAEASFPVGGGDRAPSIGIAGMYGVKASDADGFDVADGLSMFTFQGTIDYPVVLISPSVAILAIGGVAGHSISGDAYDTFGAFSFPLMAAVRIETGTVGALRIGGGVNVFKFPDDAFLPLDVGVEPGAWEASPGLHMSFIIDF